MLLCVLCLGSGAALAGGQTAHAHMHGSAQVLAAGPMMPAAHATATSTATTGVPSGSPVVEQASGYHLSMSKLRLPVGPFHMTGKSTVVIELVRSVKGKGTIAPGEIVVTDSMVNFTQQPPNQICASHLLNESEWNVSGTPTELILSNKKPLPIDQAIPPIVLHCVLANGAPGGIVTVANTATVKAVGDIKPGDSASDSVTIYGRDEVMPTATPTQGTTQTVEPSPTTMPDDMGTIPPTTPSIPMPTGTATVDTDPSALFDATVRVHMQEHEQYKVGRRLHVSVEPLLNMESVLSSLPASLKLGSNMHSIATDFAVPVQEITVKVVIPVGLSQLSTFGDGWAFETSAHASPAMIIARYTSTKFVPETTDVWQSLPTIYVQGVLNENAAPGLSVSAITEAVGDSNVENNESVASVAVEPGMLPALNNMQPQQMDIDQRKRG